MQTAHRRPVLHPATMPDAATFARHKTAAKLAPHVYSTCFVLPRFRFVPTASITMPPHALRRYDSRRAVSRLQTYIGTCGLKVLEVPKTPLAPVAAGDEVPQDCGFRAIVDVVAQRELKLPGRPGILNGAIDHLHVVESVGNLRAAVVKHATHIMQNEDHAMRAQLLHSLENDYRKTLEGADKDLPLADLCTKWLASMAHSGALLRACAAIAIVTDSPMRVQ